METLLEQSVYDALDESLARNGKALDDHFLKNLRRKITSSAKTTRRGVEVKTEFLEWALEAIQRIVTINGGKYNSSPDKMLLYDLKQAIYPPADVSGEEFAALSVDAEVDSAKTTPSDVITSSEPMRVASLRAAEQQSTVSEAYAFPPTPRAGWPTGRPPRDYPTFTRNFKWKLVNLGVMREKFTDVIKDANIPLQLIDYDGSTICEPILSNTIVGTPNLFN